MAAWNFDNLHREIFQAQQEERLSRQAEEDERLARELQRVFDEEQRDDDQDLAEAQAVATEQAHRSAVVDGQVNDLTQGPGPATLHHRRMLENNRHHPAEDNDPMADPHVIPGHNDDDPSNIRMVNCVACDETYPSNHVVPAPCDHAYCAGCLRTLFERSMNDEELFPPRCCRQNISWRRARPLLGPELAQRFDARAEELSTADRTYCHDPACATFIPPGSIHGDSGRCPQCTNETCRICKGERHAGDCPEDRGVQEVLVLAQQEGWRRCDNCHRMVELRAGCNHIT